MTTTPLRGSSTRRLPFPFLPAPLRRKRLKGSSAIDGAWHSVTRDRARRWPERAIRIVCALLIRGIAILVATGGPAAAAGRVVVGITSLSPGTTPLCAGKQKRFLGGSASPFPNARGETDLL